MIAHAFISTGKSGVSHAPAARVSAAGNPADYQPTQSTKHSPAQQVSPVLLRIRALRYTLIYILYDCADTWRSLSWFVSKTSGN